MWLEYWCEKVWLVQRGQRKREKTWFIDQAHIIGSERQNSVWDLLKPSHWNRKEANRVMGWAKQPPDRQVRPMPWIATRKFWTPGVVVCGALTPNYSQNRNTARIANSLVALEAAFYLQKLEWFMWKKVFVSTLLTNRYKLLEKIK